MSTCGQRLVAVGEVTVVEVGAEGNACSDLRREFARVAPPLLAGVGQENLEIEPAPHLRAIAPGRYE